MNNIKDNSSALTALCTLTSYRQLLTLKLKAAQTFTAETVTDFDTGLQIKILAPEKYRNTLNGAILYQNYPLMACAADADKDLIILPVPYFADKKTNLVLRVYNHTTSDITVAAGTSIARLVPSSFMPYED